MQKRMVLLFGLLISGKLMAQELYVYSDPASNVPARSVSLKLTQHIVGSDNIYSRFSTRLMPQVYAGFSKKLMGAAGVTFANMHTPGFRYESFNVYTKYRFLSIDDLHRHFRMAVFADASVTRVPFHYDEISLMGDKSGVEFGLIATQLWHKLAVSATLSQTQVLDASRKSKTLYIPARSYQSFNYILSAGYLVLPKEYTDYRQTNLNIYLEILGQRTLDQKKYYLDIAPAIQLILNSNTKINLGHRFQAGSNMDRMANNSWQLSVERTFLNAIRKK